VLDAQGQVGATSAIPMPAPVQEYLARHGIHGLPPMLRHFYAPLLQGRAQQVLEGFGEQCFWLGRQYGVAIRRQAGTGIIAITADAEEILKLRQEMGLERLLDDLATNPILAYVVLYDPALTVVAQTPSAQLKTTDADPLLRRGEVARLNTIVQDFLTLARAPRPQRESAAVNTLLQEVTSLLKAEAKARSLVLTVEAPQSLPVLLIDRQQLKQALINVVLNALQATPSGGTIQVTATDEGDGVRITIIDSGSGIAPDLLDRIFDPYFTTKPDGTGLELPIALRIIQAHGGTLDVSSIPGQGATVEVRLPYGPHTLRAAGTPHDLP
jgi:signal transduction histidine kinase